MSKKKEEKKKKTDETNESFFAKYWFVLLMTVALVVFCGFYVKQTIDSAPVTVESLTVDGKSVVYDMDGDYYYEDDLYEDLYASNGVSQTLNQFISAILDAAYETTSEMRTNASNMASYYISYYGEEELVDSLKSMGYYNGIEDLTTYYIMYYKNMQMVKDYYSAHYDEYVPEAIEELNAKAISTLLVKVENIETGEDDEGNTVYTLNPTEEESKKLEDVLSALKTKDFNEVAKEYSDNDNAANGGYITVCDEDSLTELFTDEIAETVKELENGNYSEAFESSGGYLIVYVDEPTKEECMDSDTFVQSLNSHYSSHYTAVLMDKASEVDYVIYDEDLQKQIDSELEAESEEE